MKDKVIPYASRSPDLERTFLGIVSLAMFGLSLGLPVIAAALDMPSAVLPIAVPVYVGCVFLGIICGVIALVKTRGRSATDWIGLVMNIGLAGLTFIAASSLHP